jgi:Glyoxalase/Bleomycin resistance protein/Dioxygenase superfamily
MSGGPATISSRFDCVARMRPGDTEVKLNYAIVFVADMSRSVAFYRDTLGIPSARRVKLLRKRV